MLLAQQQKQLQKELLLALSNDCKIFMVGLSKLEVEQISTDTLYSYHSKLLSHLLDYIELQGYHNHPILSTFTYNSKNSLDLFIESHLNRSDMRKQHLEQLKRNLIELLQVLTLHKQEIKNRKEQIPSTVNLPSETKKEVPNSDMIKAMTKEKLKELKDLKIQFKTFSDLVRFQLGDFSKEILQIRNKIIPALNTQNRLKDFENLKDFLDEKTKSVRNSYTKLTEDVELIRKDFLTKKIYPSHNHIENLLQSFGSTNKDLNQIHLILEGDVLPKWKKIWEKELTNVVEEQTSLKHYQSILDKLDQSQTDLEDLFKHLKPIAELAPDPLQNRLSSSPTRSKKLPLRPYIPPEQDQNHGGLSSVLNELSVLDVNSEKRLKALEENEKKRNNKGKYVNEFEKELESFVETGKLKKVGLEELERNRQRKESQILKKIFNSNDN